MAVRVPIPSSPELRRSALDEVVYAEGPVTYRLLGADEQVRTTAAAVTLEGVTATVRILYELSWEPGSLG